ncbi:DinB family protein [Mycobacterium sp. SVM_VP21]|nr:DinB family protein [Mycobacterium sp. SVM_VP21]
MGDHRAPDSGDNEMVNGNGIPPLAGEDHVCATCALTYADITIERAVDEIKRLPPAVLRDVAALSADARRLRLDPSEWSVTEYVCHLRDVYMASTIRLHRIRTEDRPAVEPLFNDLRAVRFRYNECDPIGIVDELASAVAGFLDEVARTIGQDWDRTATRLPGETRSARWIVRQAMHEGIHHLADIRRIAGSVPPGSPS